MGLRSIRYLAAGAALTALLWCGAVPACAEDSQAGGAGTAPAGTAAAPGDTANAPPASKEGAAKGKAHAKGKGKAASKKAAAKGKEKSMGALPGTMPVKPAVEPKHVMVQHILIGFRGSVPGKDIQRTKDEAKKLAYEILERARKGEDYDALVQKYTDDSPPGIYSMSGNGVEPAAGEYARSGMVPAFGNVGFAISPGNIGIADYDPQASPFGWHIIKRLK